MTSFLQRAKISMKPLLYDSSKRCNQSSVKGRISVRVMTLDIVNRRTPRNLRELGKGRDGTRFKLHENVHFLLVSNPFFFINNDLSYPSFVLQITCFSRVRIMVSDAVIIFVNALRT